MMPSLSPSWPTWLQPRALVGGLGLMISAFRNLRAGLREEIREMKHESFHRRRPSLESEDQQDFHGANKARGQIKRVNTSAPCSLRLSVSLLQVGCPFMDHWLIGFPMGEVPILKGRGCVTSGEGGREDRVLRGSFLSPTAFGGWVKDGLTDGCPLLPKGLLRNSAYFDYTFSAPGIPGQLVTQPGALVAGAVGGLGLLISAFRSLRVDLKEEMRASEGRVNRRIDEVKEQMREFKEEMKEIRSLLIWALHLSPEAKP